jgi:protein-tyrosine-phosphatase
MTDVLFVCSGNTCRSPMAECLFNDLCQKRGLPYRAESAGMNATEGNVASQNAFLAMKERGLSLARHVSRSLSMSAAKDARLVVAMNERLAQGVLLRYPEARVLYFQPSISDPFGGSLTVYRTTADELAGHMDWVLRQLSET